MTDGVVLWEPAVYEHKAALIGRSPADVARSADLLAEALLAEHDAYHADFITVGVDVYNVEAEAIGAEVVAGDRSSCPEIPRPPWSLDALPFELTLPGLRRRGRFALMLETGARVRERLSGRGGMEVLELRTRGGPAVRVAASGPLSIAAKLVGTEELLVGILTEEPAAERLLEFTTHVGLAWLAAIRDAGLEAVVFDSTASPPMIGPDLYARAIAPRHARQMALLRERGQELRPLVVGGDTTTVAELLAGTGATQLVCDYNSDAHAYAVALGTGSGVIAVRRNVDPARIRDAASIADAAATLASELELVSGAVAGTGILPYDQDPRSLQRFRHALDEARGEALQEGER